MATTTRVLSASVNGTVYTTNANGALEAIDTCHSGATAPTNEVANGKFWLDTTTTPGILKMYNNAAWEEIGGSTSSPTFAGLTTTADISFGDNDKATFGASSDLQIYHDGTNSFISDTGTGDLFIKASNNHYMQFANGEYAIVTTENAGVGLRYNNVEKIATTSAGATITGDLIATGAVTPASLVVNGNNYPSAGALSNRNVILNGAMNVAQRDDRAYTTFSGAFYAGPDRWRGDRSGTGHTGFSQIASTAYGGTKAAEAEFNMAATETCVVEQRIESGNIAHLAGQTVTLSFWASGSSTAGSATLDATLSYATTTDVFTTQTDISSNSVTYSGTAAYYTFTYTLPAGAANGVSVKFEGTKTDATGILTLTFGGVQLEAGDTSTPFEHRSYGQELALCQRYFNKLTYGANDTPILNAAYYNSTNAYGSVSLQTEMRVYPTLVVSAASDFKSLSNGSSKIPASINISGSSTKNPELVFNTAGHVQSHAAFIRTNNTSAVMTLDAEL